MALGHGPHPDLDPAPHFLVRPGLQRALGYGPHPSRDPGRDTVPEIPMPPRQRKKSVAQRAAPAEQPPTTPLHDPKSFDRFQFFSQRRVFQPYVLSLDVADEFGIREEVEAMVSLPEWRYLLMDFAEDTYKSMLMEVMTTMKLPKFDGLTSSPCVQFHLTKEERDKRVANVPNIQRFWEELTDGTSVYRSSRSRSSVFLKREHKFMQYQLGHSVCGRFDATSSVNHADLFCLYGMVKYVRLHMGVVIWNLFMNQNYPRGAALYLGPYLTLILCATQRIVLVEPKEAGMQPVTADAVARMQDKIEPKRARTSVMVDERMEEEAYEADPDTAAPVHAKAGGSSSSFDFQQQVLAQLAAMNMRFDHIDNRLDEMEAANAQSRAEAHAYYEWMRGHYPP
nr:hypothetical protein GOBAR_AA21570 [Ipomoea batatas]